MPVLSQRTFRTARAGLLALAVATAGLFSGAAVVMTGAALFSAPAHAEAQVMRRLGLNKSAIMRLPAGVKDIVVGNTEVADVVLRSRRTMYIFARKLGQTNIFLLDARGEPIMQVVLAVVPNKEVLERMLKKALPDSNIRVEVMETQFLLTGTVKRPGDANKAMQIAQNYAASLSGASKATATSSGSKTKTSSKGGLQVVNALRITGKDQVMIKVKLAEVQRDVFKQLRSNFSEIRFSTGNLSGLVGLAFPFSLGNSLSTAGANLTITGGKVGGSMLLEVLERDGLIRLLAEPTLTAVSGEAARFMAGGEIPTIVGYDPLKGYTYQWKPFGVLLGFTPLVLDEGRISLKVNIEVSELSNKYVLPIGDLTIPGFEKRQAATTVELPSGGTLALAGLIREQTKQNIDGVPGLKNLPILGALFRSRDFQSNQSELVVMATPYIVNPVNEKKLRTPLDRLNFASDYQTYFLGQLHRVYGAPVKARSNGLNYHGNIGFILD